MPTNKAAAILREVRGFIRAPYAWPGGYPRALITSDGETLCAACARAEYRQISNETRHHLRGGWCADSVAILWEGPPEFCAHCNAEMPTAYGDPDAPDEAADA